MPSTSTDRIDGLTTSVAVKAPVRVASTANLTLAGVQTVNGVSLSDGDRVLVKDQTTQSENGIYVVSTGNWTRAKDFDGNRDVVQGTLVVVNDNTDLYYRVTAADDITVDSTAITFEAVSAVITRSAIGQALFPTTDDENAALVSPTSFFYDTTPYGDIRRYNATEGSNVTSAVNTAISVFAQHGGGTVLIPFKQCSMNLTITQENITILGVTGGYNTTTCYISAANSANPVIQLGDATHQVQDCTLKNFTLRAGASDTAGLLVANAYHTRVSGVSIRNFTSYQAKVTSQATFGTTYTSFDSCHLAAKAAAASKCFIGDYGGAYAVRTGFINSDLSGSSSGTGAYVIDLNENFELEGVRTSVQCFNGNGVRMTGSQSRLRGNLFIIDSDASTDTLLELDTDSNLANRLIGIITVDGVCTMPAGTTGQLTARNWIADKSFLLNPQVLSSLYVIDGNLAANAQYSASSPTTSISRSGNNFNINNASGAVVVNSSGSVNDGLQVYSGANPARVQCMQMQIQDGITAPSTVSGFAVIYVDTADGDLKVKFGDGTVKTIVVDT